MRPIHARRLVWSSLIAHAVGIASPAQAQVRLENAEIVTRVSHGVVTIATFDGAGTQVGQGSGFVIGDGLSVATNYHVALGASTATVRFSDGVERAVLGYTAADANRDAIVLRLDGIPGRPLALADSDSLPTGDDVVVIGAPEGFQQTVTTGVTSGTVELGGVDWLQFSAPVSAGSSGSPVLDRSAAVVGMVTQILPDVPQVNFATPSNVVRELVEASDSIFPLEDLNTGVEAAFTPEQIGWLRSLPTMDRALAIGGTVRGELTSDDELGWDGTYVQAWRLQSDSTAAVHVDLISSAFDAFLMVLPPDSGAPMFDDDSGGACHSRVTIDAPSEADYIVVVNTITEEATGGFELRASPDALPLAQGSCIADALSWFRALDADDRSIRRQEEKFGTLTRRDSLWTADATLVQAWDLVLDTPGSVTIDLISTEFDAFLYVLTPGGEQFSDDDAGGACNARVSLVDAVVGTYRLVVNTAFSDQVGAFRLRITEEAGELAAGECGA